jgi:hypothetical protein
MDEADEVAAHMTLFALLGGGQDRHAPDRQQLHRAHWPLGKSGVPPSALNCSTQCGAT